MRQIIVTTFVSLDGVMEAPGGNESYRNAGWTFNGVEFDPSVYDVKGVEQEETTALLLGRVSYELFAPVWPTMDEFAGYNAMPRYVVSTSLDSEDERWPATILRSVEDVAELKACDGGPIAVHGSATLAQSLLEAGLVDRYHLMIFPVLLGSGQRLWGTPDMDLQKLKLVEHQTFANGIQWQIWDIVH